MMQLIEDTTNDIFYTFVVKRMPVYVCNENLITESNKNTFFLKDLENLSKVSKSLKTHTVWLNEV